MQHAFICPFTKQPLELLSMADLALLNKKINANQLYFQPGIPISFEIKKAFISTNRVYVYPVMDGMLMLQKQTAIVERNRTVHPRKRITEADVTSFHQALGFGLDGVFVDRPITDAIEPSIAANAFQDLKRLVSASGALMVTLGTCQVDLLQELEETLDYEQHIHLDNNPDRLRRVIGKLPSETLYILCDSQCFPLKKHCVDTLFAFNALGLAEEDAKKGGYEALKKGLNPNRSHVCLTDSTKKNRLQSAYNSDVRSAKLKLWKKASLPKIHFHAVSFV